MKNIEDKIINQTANIEEISQWEKYVFDNFSNIDLDKVKILREKAEEIKQKEALKNGVLLYIQACEKIIKMEQESHEIQEYIKLINSIKSITPTQFSLLKQYCRESVLSKISQISSITTPRVSEKKISYTQEDRLLSTPPRIQEMYLALRDQILGFGSGIEIEPTRVYIIFRGSIRSIGSVLIQKKQIKVYPNFKKDEKDRFFDPKGIVRDISDNGIWGRDYEIIFDHISQLEDIVMIMKQSYEING